MVYFQDQKPKEERQRQDIYDAYSTCFVVAPDIRRSVVTIPGCNTQRKWLRTKKKKIRHVSGPGTLDDTVLEPGNQKLAGLLVLHSTSWRY